MRTETRDGSQERRILTGMIVDTAVLGRIAARWPKQAEGLFRTRYANLVARWCIKYYDKYSRAPGRAIETIAEEWAEKGRDKETVALIDRFLGSLSDEYEQNGAANNSDYTIDLAGEYFNRVRLAQLAEAIQDDIAAGRDDDAQSKLNNYSRVEVGVGAGIDLLQDHDAIRSAFEENTDPIIEYPGDVGRFLNPAFERDGFVAFQGKKGSGKTWFLIDLAWRAMLQRKRVAFFEIGDMSQNQIIRRFMVRCARVPYRQTKVKVPTSLKPTADYDCHVGFERKQYDQPLSWQVAAKSAERIMRAKLRSKNPYLKISAHPARSVNIDTIKETLIGWAREDFVADICFIDYMDLLAPLPGAPRDNRREQINDDWITARGLAQTLHCLLVTATQSDANSYTATLQRAGHFTDDRRKNDHVSAMIGINQTDQEKEQQRWRLNLTKLRDGDFSETRVCHVAGCLALGNPVVKSCLWSPPDEEGDD